MRSGFIGLLVFMISCLSAPVAAQSLVVQGAAGPTLGDAGVSAAGGIGFSPSSRITLLGSVERTHILSRFSSDGRGRSSAFRGGTLTLGTAEVRVALFGRDRVSPYILAGFGLGIAKPNVNDTFPSRITNDARAVFAGGGISVPLRQRWTLFADARMVIGDEAGELLAIAPIRAGLTWRF